jgi:multicomponent K+:H+ antiporter subunit G
MLGFMRWGQGSGHELLIAFFLFLTAPVSAHLLVKAALKRWPQEAPKPPG